MLLKIPLLHHAVGHDPKIETNIEIVRPDGSAFRLTQPKIKPDAI
jgi:hypothetical protein